LFQTISAKHKKGSSVARPNPGVNSEQLHDPAWVHYHHYRTLPVKVAELFYSILPPHPRARLP